MAATPTFVANGARVAGQGAVTVDWPAGSHATDDIGLLYVETANQGVFFTTLASFATVTDSPQGTGTAGGTAATRISVFWSRATCATMGSPVLGDAGDHQQARISVFRGCIATGDPWSVTSGNVWAAATSVCTTPGATTLHDNCLVVDIGTTSTDTTLGQNVGGPFNATLSEIQEIANLSTTQGNGGGWTVSTGTKASAGAYSGTTWALNASSALGVITIALRPPADAAPSAARGDYHQFLVRGAHL